METKKKGGFSGSLGFVLAAAGSAVGVGNIWRFPYLAAKHSGGLFLLVYLILVLTFGFTLLTTDITLGHKTKLSPLRAFSSVRPKWGFMGNMGTFIGWVVGPQWLIDGVESIGHSFKRRSLYIVMIRFIAPAVMFVLFLQSTGVLRWVQSLF